MSPIPTTYVLVDLQAVRHNVRQILSRLKAGTSLCAVVKANAYGHGLVPFARACVEEGATWLAVSTVDEGVRLREAGLAVPILVFMPPLPQECSALVEHDLTATVTSVEQVMELKREGERQGKVAHAEVYEDLGLARLGPKESVVELIEVAEPWPSVQVTGVYSHFGPPGSGVNLDPIDWIRRGSTVKVYAAMLFEAIRRVTDRRLSFHVAASGLFLEEPEYQFDRVRIGTLLGGQYPDHIPEKLRTLNLRNTFELRSRIVSVHQVEKGARVGYGGEFVCVRPTRIATVPVGFAHGLSLLPESVATRPQVFLKGLLRRQAARRGRAAALPRATVGDLSAPIIGRVSMDQCCLDVTDIPDADRGTEVVLPVRRVLVNPSIPRIYRDDPEPSSC